MLLFFFSLCYKLKHSRFARYGVLTAVLLGNVTLRCWGGGSRRFDGMSCHIFKVQSPDLLEESSAFVFKDEYIRNTSICVCIYEYIMRVGPSQFNIQLVIASCYQLATVANIVHSLPDSLSKPSAFRLGKACRRSVLYVLQCLEYLDALVPQNLPVTNTKKPTHAMSSQTLS